MSTCYTCNRASNNGYLKNGIFICKNCNLNKKFNCRYCEEMFIFDFYTCWCSDEIPTNDSEQTCSKCTVLCNICKQINPTDCTKMCVNCSDIVCDDCCVRKDDESVCKNCICSHCDGRGY